MFSRTTLRLCSPPATTVSTQKERRVFVAFTASGEKPEKPKAKTRKTTTAFLCLRPRVRGEGGSSAASAIAGTPSQISRLACFALSPCLLQLAAHDARLSHLPTSLLQSHAPDARKAHHRGSRVVDCTGTRKSRKVDHVLVQLVERAQRLDPQGDGRRQRWQRWQRWGGSWAKSVDGKEKGTPLSRRAFKGVEGRDARMADNDIAQGRQQSRSSRISQSSQVAD